MVVYTPVTVIKSDRLVFGRDNDVTSCGCLILAPLLSEALKLNITVMALEKTFVLTKFLSLTFSSCVTKI